MKTKIFTILFLFLISVMSYFLGFQNGKKKYEEIGVKASLYSSGSIYLENYYEYGKLKKIILEDDSKKALLELSVKMKLIESILSDCFGQSACGTYFKGRYPDAWVDEINKYKRREQQGASGKQENGNRENRN